MSLGVAVLGAGRMGQEIIRAIGSSDELHLAGVWSRKAPDDEIVVSDDLTAVLSGADVAIDFTLPEATPKVLAAVLSARKPLVIGVSGLEDAALGELDATAEQIPILYDRNMSLGIAVLDGLVREAAVILGDAYEAEIHETHHVHKKDAPSGTALKLGASLADARQQDFGSVSEYDPGGLKRPLAPGKIGFEVTREGEVPGEHTVIFYSDSERLELKHIALSRRVFAMGALEACRWLSSQPSGLYKMRDLLSRRPGPAS